MNYREEYQKWKALSFLDEKLKSELVKIENDEEAIKNHFSCFCDFGIVKFSIFRIIFSSSFIKNLSKFAPEKCKFSNSTPCLRSKTSTTNKRANAIKNL